MAQTPPPAPPSAWNRTAFWLTCAATALAAGCAVGPDYKRPAPVAPLAFKETEGWKAAQPQDAAPRGPWWEVFQDPLLNSLESQVAISNQNLAAAAANYEEARQLARSDRTGFLPTVSVNGSAQRAKSPGARTAANGGAVVPGGTSNTFAASLQASWEPDVWGKVSRTVEADVANAQADAAELAALRLSTQSTLAQDYIQLRALDEKNRLLANAVKDYSRTLMISKNKYAVGVSARSDVISAQSELDSTRAQLVDVGVLRAQLEHAIAVLVGKLPADLHLEFQDRVSLGLVLPDIPLQVPSALLERRPDVAQSERLVAAANAKVGIQTAAYFPTLSLTGAGGFQGSPLHQLFTTPFRYWSLGGQIADSLIDWGARHDQVLAARAAYDGTVATYRQTVLTAVQQVEDNLSGLHILAQEAEIEDAAVAEAAEAARITLNEYNAGTVDYTTVVTAQVAELTNRESALTIRQSRLIDSVALIVALGGGWTAADLPGAHEVVTRHSPAPAAVAATK
jgi:NodT family efflux transporter outer membrane factor (OMF) lipoprotein